MSGQVTESALEAARDVRYCAGQTLRNAYPYMKTRTLEKLLDKLEVDCKQALLEQEPEHRRTKSRSNFFSLSAELRNKIYELALAPAVDDHPRPSAYFLRSTKQQYRTIYSRPGLLSVSRQVRSETLSIYYSTALAFDFISFEGIYGFESAPPAPKLRSYLRAIGPHQAGMIRELRLLISHDDRPLFMDGEEAAIDYIERYDLHKFDVPQAAWALSTC